MQPFRLGLVAVVSGVLLLASPEPRPARAATSDQIEESIQKAKAYLYATEKTNNWELVASPNPKDNSVKGAAFGGITAFNTYALLATGESPRNEKLAGAVEFVKKLELHGIYAVSTRAMMLSYLPQTPDVKQLAHKDADALLHMIKTQGQAEGMYHYVLSNRGQDYDLSVSQFAVLGMWSAEQMGVEVPTTYWGDVDRAWRAHQEKDGGWAYVHESKANADEPRITPSMTAAGVATLFITQDYLTGGATGCRGTVRNDAIDRGIAWLADHYPETYAQKVFGMNAAYYGLFGMSRIGVASGLRYFGTVDWFREGADFLIKTQNPKDGSWPATDARMATANTAFGLLFLHRGRAPVMMNKLQYGVAAGKTEGKWNERPRDAANLTRWYARESENDLNWQIVDFDSEPEEWHDSPVLYLAGSDPVELAPEQAAKIKRFVDQGGLVLANADCGSKPFTESVRKLARDLYPDYEFAELPDASVIYANQNYPRSRWKNRPSVLGLSNGARELFLLLPDADAGKFWHMRAAQSRADLFELGADVFSYTIEHGIFRYKGDRYWTTPDAKVKTTRSLKVARLQYNGNWDPEPGGWQRFSAVARNADKLALSVTPVKIGDGSLKGYALAHLTGTSRFSLDGAQREEIRKFVDDGGTLLIDSTGGNGSFATAAETELKQIFGANAATMLAMPLPPDDPLFTRAGAKVAHFGYRSFAKKTLGLSGNAPRVHGLRINNRLAVVYSAEDLSVGLVGMPVDGVIGYDPATATAIVRAVVLTAAGG